MQKTQGKGVEKVTVRCVFVTHPAILVLIFLNDVVDCVQELFDGACYVSVQRNRKHVRRDLMCDCTHAFIYTVYEQCPFFLSCI